MKYIVAVLLIAVSCQGEDRADKNEKQFVRSENGRQFGFPNPGQYSAGAGGGQRLPDDGQGYSGQQQAYPGLRGYPALQNTYPQQQGYPGPQGYAGQHPLYPGPQQGGYPGDFQFDPYAAQQPQYPVPQYGGYYPQQHPQQQGIPGQPPQGYYPGQPFLLNPSGGGGPPNNFLYPQQPGAHPQQPGGGVDPNIFRNNPFPQPPVYVAGYPKPAHIPPIEKDAEQIPTIPKQIPQMRPSAGKKPEKIELDDENDAKESEKPGGENRPKTPLRNLLNLRPGQRFFILNGQPLFSNYALGGGSLNPFQSERFNEQPNPFLFRQNPYYQQQNQQQQPINRQTALQNFFLRNGPITNFNKPLQNEIKDDLQYPQLDKPQDDSPPGVLLRDSLPFLLHDQLVNKEIVPDVLLREPTVNQDDESELHQSRYYEKGLPVEQNVQQEPAVASLYSGNVRPGIAYDYYRYNDHNDDDDNDAVVIDAKVQDVPEENDTEDIEADTEKAIGSSVAQAQPGAIALAGPGGVAAAGPRGTALAGEGGLAVASPQATAVAGPSRDDDVPEKKTKVKKQSKLN